MVEYSAALSSDALRTATPRAHRSLSGQTRVVDGHCRGAHRRAATAGLARSVAPVPRAPRFSWRIDSKFAPTVKTNTFGFNPGEGPLPAIATSRCFVYVLYCLLHLKFGVLRSPPPELLARSDAHPGMDPWFEWKKHMQQYPQTDGPAAFAGAPLLDWSTD